MSQRRDAQFDRLLSQRYAATPASVSAECLDGEALGAWMARQMAPEEAGRVEAHVADCARCQAMLAMFVRTAPAAPPPAPPWWRLRLGWLVPLATAVLVVAVWVAVPDPPPPALPQVAGNGVSAGPAAARPAPSPAPTVRAGSAPAPAPDISSAKAQVTGSPRDTMTPEERRRSEVAARPGPAAPLPGESVAQRAGSPAAAAADRAERVAAGAPPPPAPPAPAASPAAPPPMMLAESLAVMRDILSPDPQRVWRIVGDRLVQRSTDGGATWVPMALDAGVPLTAGHAPAPDILWLVGNAGTIYLSVDGKAFERVPFVQRVDLRAVTASDARAARVTTADGLVWQTTDRGATWVQVR